MRAKFLLIVIASFMVIPTVSPADLPSPLRLSMVNLIATPEKFDGKLVSVKGLLHVDRELAVLFLGKNDRDHAIIENAISFRLNEQMGKDITSLNENYVYIIGVFRSVRPGAYPCPNGTIDPVERYGISSLLSNPAGRLLDDPKKP